MKDIVSWDVYLVTDVSLSRGRSNLEIVQAAVQAGVSVVQLREKNLSAHDYFSEGRKIKDFLVQQNVPLIINDRIEVALALDADGVHLGQTDVSLEIARKILGPEKIIGWSVNDLSHISEEEASLADYLAISPVFFTSTKKDISAPWGIEGVRKARSITQSPLLGIGGIDLDNASDVILAGLDCIAVVSAIVSAEDPFLATKSLVATVRKAKQARQIR